MAGRMNANPSKNATVKHPTILGYNLRFLRLAMGYSLMDIERMTGRVRSNINGIENGVVKDHGETARELEAFFGFSFGGLRHVRISHVETFLSAPDQPPDRIRVCFPIIRAAGFPEGFSEFRVVTLTRGTDNRPLMVHP